MTHSNSYKGVPRWFVLPPDCISDLGVNLLVCIEIFQVPQISAKVQRHVSQLVNWPKVLANVGVSSDIHQVSLYPK